MLKKTGTSQGTWMIKVIIPPTMDPAIGFITSELLEDSLPAPEPSRIETLSPCSGLLPMHVLPHRRPLCGSLGKNRRYVPEVRMIPIDRNRVSHEQHIVNDTDTCHLALQLEE
jgi:hypothetical protein